MNKVILMGRLTKDPELRYTSANNTAICNFSIAVDRRSKQENQPQADFFNIVAWSKLGEFCSKYFTKGNKIAIVGRLQNRTWEDTDKKKHYITEVVAEEAHFVESKRSEGGASRPFESSDMPYPDDIIVPIDDDGDVPF